jgi:hypothetical protein
MTTHEKRLRHRAAHHDGLSCEEGAMLLWAVQEIDRLRDRLEAPQQPQYPSHEPTEPPTTSP